MNSDHFEIFKAVRQVQRGPTTIRYICLICKRYLNGWDIRKGFAVCWKCREIHIIPPKIEVKNPQPAPQKATLLQLKDGNFVILVE